MPQYTFECPDFEEREDVIMPMSEAGKKIPKCLKCKVEMQRVYITHNVIQDTFKEPISLYNMKPALMNGPKYRGKQRFDVISSESERRKFAKAYEQKYGHKITPTL